MAKMVAVLFVVDVFAWPLYMGHTFHQFVPLVETSIKPVSSTDPNHLNCGLIVDGVVVVVIKILS